MDKNMMKINMFDNAFKHQGYSTLGQKPDKVEVVWEQRDWEGVTFFTDDYLESPIVDQINSTVKVGWLLECKEYSPARYDNFENYMDKFDYVLTHDEYLLKTYPEKTKQNILGGCWIKKEDTKIHPKSKDASIIYSHKGFMQGHKLRHAIANRFGDKLGLYGNGSPNPVDYKLEALEDYRFSIVIENAKCNNYFTEKIVDAFATGTVPIYWGCPNIGEFFDTDSIIVFDTIEELSDILDNLSDELYMSKMDSLKKNLVRMEEYRNTEDYIYENHLKCD